MPKHNAMTQVIIERTVSDIGVDDIDDRSSGDISIGSTQSTGSPSMDSQLSDSSGQNESDLETEELAKMRCSSVQTEVISERRRRNPSAGYPGLAFGGSLFSSGTIMKFRVISNELHNIQNVQLKRAEGEMAALQKRIQVLEKDLEKSEESLKIATEELDIVSQEFDRDDRTTTSYNTVQQDLIDRYLAMIPTMKPFERLNDQFIKSA
ncbi:uncharacterized protein LOC128958115 [Oppia nitens]|uniref:uncharacterized protein LOC128958115 n=1 Tax=Oppia nitens TaxID=1686743 RepID=UPI0023DBEB4A|nr:uncharacterized protein LOC128958115 [Oppia nitens]